jgi:hypothetical protein
MSDNGWEHKEEWAKFGNGFSIVVRRHEASEGAGLGKYRWCVYAYIYPKHRTFSAYKGNDMWQDAACALPLHGGPTFLRWHRNDSGEAVSVQVGADYNHLHDDPYTYYRTPDDACCVFQDAETLFKHLSESEDT